MKLQFLGTAAAEGVPGLFCDCDTCRKARARGGRHIRSRSQSIVNDSLLIDYSADTLWHLTRENIDLCNIHHCIITHVHQDHFYPLDMYYPKKGFSEPPEGYHFEVCGSVDIVPEMEKVREDTAGNVDYRVLEPYVPVRIGDFTVTPLRGLHGTDNPYFYAISDGEKNLLYAHDTDDFPEATWEYLKKSGLRFDLVSMDCTGGAFPSLPYKGHMCIGTNRIVREKLLSLGLADKKTRFVLNHFSHNGKDASYDEFCAIAIPQGFEVSYDGMTAIF